MRDPSRGQVVSVNNPGLSLDQMVYLLKYDSAHGRIHDSEVTHNGKDLLVNNQPIKVYQELDPSKINWRDSGATTILECTGKFLTEDKVKVHLNNGAEKVVMSAPSKDHTKMFVYGVNHNEYKGQKIVSNASCTTNCLAPLAHVLHKYFGIEEALMTTIHAVTIS